MIKSLGILLSSVLLVSVVVIAGCSKGYEAKKNTNDLSVTLKADRYPLIKGDNDLSVSVADPGGKIIPDVTVRVRYYMPPMPGMAPMEYSPQTALKGNEYPFTANIPMEGVWKVEVTAARPGKPAITATFNVDAR